MGIGVSLLSVWVTLEPRALHDNNETYFAKRNSGKMFLFLVFPNQGATSEREVARKVKLDIFGTGSEHVPIVTACCASMVSQRYAKMFSIR